jgi:hypothetical protein
MVRTDEEIRLVRNFAENSVKFLLHDKDNAREGLTLMAPDYAPLIDFDRMAVVRATFVAPDFRHLETDLLLKAPLRGRPGKGKPAVYVYQLFEHQTQPDDHATYRATRYVMQVLDLQAREWKGRPRDLAFDPVLPVIVYTGTRKWDRPKPIHELIKQGKLFARHTPSLEPVFFNLSMTPAERLHEEAGLFGRVLHLMQQRRAGKEAFRALLEEVMRHVDGLPTSAQGRWHDLLWYLRAMVYHVREEKEHEPLVEIIHEAERAKSRQAEVLAMGKTMAEVLEERGVLRGKQEALLRLLRKQFGKLPAGVEAQVKGTADDAKLDQWLDEILTAAKLADMSFPPHS